VLVEPDRHPRPQAQDQVAGDPRLALGERIWARVVRVPGAAAALPLRRPVGVQVNATAVLTRPPQVPVRVQVGDDPDVEARPDTLERAGNADTGAFGAVNTADDEHPCAVCLADVNGDDRAPALRAPEPDQAHGLNRSGRDAL